MSLTHVLRKLRLLKSQRVRQTKSIQLIRNIIREKRERKKKECVCLVVVIIWLSKTRIEERNFVPMNALLIIASKRYI